LGPIVCVRGVPGPHGTHGPVAWIVDNLHWGPSLSMTVASSLSSLPAVMAGRLDRLSDRKFAFVAFLPGGLLVGLVLLPPIFAVLVVSFFRIELLKDDNVFFAGLRNYERLVADPSFLDAVPRTLVFALGATILTIPLALATAMLLARGFRGATVLGIAILLPWAVAPVVTGLYWKFIFQSQFGLATGLANIVGFADGPVLWLAEPQTAILVAILASAWRTVPLMAILLLAALKTIPEAQYRAAKMDGATSWEAFRFVTLPSIRNTLLVASILSLILTLQTFDVLFTLTGGGPGTSTTVIIYYIYKSAIGTLSFGYSSALAVFLFVLIALCSSLMLVWRLRERRPAVEDSDDPLTVAIAAPRHSAAVAAPRTDFVQQVRYEVGPPRRRFRLPVPARKALFTLGVGGLLLWILGPIAWIAITSVQPEGAVTQRPPALTTDLRLDRYGELLAKPEWQQGIFVSLEVTLAVTVISLVFGAMAAYPLARLALPGKRTVLTVLLFTQMVPAIVMAIPVMLMFRAVGLRDTVHGLVLLNVAFWLPLVIWLLRNVLEDVPRSLEYAARMDGCSRIGTLFRVLIPAAQPGFAAVAILLLIGTWNEFLFAVLIGDRNAITVTRLIGFLDSTIGPDGPPPFTLLAAAGIVAILPCLALVIVFHRRIVAGLTQGFVKG
jgi:multiple sugar transport system permease protein